MTKNALIRIWQEVDIKTVEPHLLIAGHTTADCGNCKEIGISLDAVTCPKCGTAFKYISSRIFDSSKEAKRFKVRRPDLTIIDFRDFKEIQARIKAHGFLGE
ncbi:MAG: hypothetical protein JW994_08115 [Candidatus Omnitrophica bacterium]|nr:hypothetical protein [Candidatus Omnitrophota bacterium]